MQERGRLRWQHIKKVDEKEPGRLSQRQSDPSRTPTRHTHSNHQQIALAVEAGLLYTPYQKWQQIPKAFGGKRRPGSNKQAKHPVKSRRLQAAFIAARTRFPTEISLNIFGAPLRGSLAQPDDKFALLAGPPNRLLYLSTPQSVVVPYGPNSLLTTVISINGLPTWQPRRLATGPVCKGLQRVIFFAAQLQP